MSRKTRKEKIIADSRLGLYQYRFEETTPEQIKVETLPNKYPHLIQDLRKTAIITFLILLNQFILFYILKNHLLTLPGLNY